MKLTRFVLPMAFILLAGQAGIGDENTQVKEKSLEASHGGERLYCRWKKGSRSGMIGEVPKRQLTRLSRRPVTRFPPVLTTLRFWRSVRSGVVGVFGLPTPAVFWLFSAQAIMPPKPISNSRIEYPTGKVTCLARIESEPGFRVRN